MNAWLNSLQQFFESFIWSSDFYKQLLVEAKDREIVIDEWKENADTINSDVSLGCLSEQIVCGNLFILSQKNGLFCSFPLLS